MPINMSKLQTTLLTMKEIRLSKKVKSVHDHSFIDVMHNYCVEELERSGLEKRPDIKILTKKEVPRLDKPKEVDVAVIHEKAGPLLLISIKSLMSSITNNFTNNYESLIGDVSMFHERFPLCVIGNIFLVPVDTSVFSGGKKENYPIPYYAKLMSRINLREDYSDNPNRFERIAFLVVDFSKNPPRVDSSIPADSSLRIESFFDELILKYRERNFSLDV